MRIAYVAQVWTDMVAPEQSVADLSDTGLLGTPPEAMALILGLAVLSANEVRPTQPLWDAQTDPASMSVDESRRGSARRLLALEQQGVAIETEARMCAVRLLA